jgi:inhibitor of cysteine peptidase
MYLPIESRVGRGGQRVLTFKVQRTGIDQLRLKLWREWQGEPSIVERFTVTLQVLRVKASQIAEG